MHISNCFPTHQSEIRQDDEKKSIVDNAIIEVYKRLCLRFPRRDIQGSDIKFCGIKATLFPDGSLGCSTKVGIFFTTPKESGFIATFSYVNRGTKENYNLHTTIGTHFFSNDLKIANEYKTNILNIAMEKLSYLIGRDVGFHEIAIIAYDEKIAYPKSFKECNNLNEYVAQKEEQQYTFEMLFESNKYSVCFNVLGYDRNIQ